MDRSKIENGVRMILEGIGENLGREGLFETPERVARMYEEVFSSTGKSNSEIADELGKLFVKPEVKRASDFSSPPKTGGLVIVKDIPAFSYCEHHMALIYDMKVTVAYRPRGFVIGLSKIPRVVDAVCKRLQIQERIGMDVFDVLRRILGHDDIWVGIEAKHACVASRGVKKDASTRTVCGGGCFSDTQWMD